MFEGRRLLIATQHKKEKIIAPILEKELGVRCFVSSNFDTDALGTFSGEIERSEDPINTVRKKCLMAMQTYDCDLAVASEGSFGPHPSLFFVPADDEFIILIDQQQNLEILARELSAETNFFAKEITHDDELQDFIKKTQFPSHGLIIKKDPNDLTDMIKGITQPELLFEAFKKFKKEYGKAYLETDMRALYNPSRMRVIEKATHRLVEKIKSTCPICKTPGFSVEQVERGLPCNSCGLPTQSILKHLYVCKKCEHRKEKPYPNDKKTEDPMYCDFCNP